MKEEDPFDRFIYLWLALIVAAQRLRTDRGARADGGVEGEGEERVRGAFRAPLDEDWRLSRGDGPDTGRVWSRVCGLSREIQGNQETPFVGAWRHRMATLGQLGSPMSVKGEC